MSQEKVQMGERNESELCPSCGHAWRYHNESGCLHFNQRSQEHEQCECVVQVIREEQP